ncbi:hypothetical protein [Paraburkholderia azotifigens]|uniref:Uncharacterized protein n=1 Tax=Paraburkholderia azotifigens TaxID=2057004 RepID=A0A5C6VPI7_9BURK|nr:hypothetical protein [Paraburkholderia azotifigens]TXC86789.1 hypothetical protein FRZ40_03900 [Paraburkholderia azotifigens]
MDTIRKRPELPHDSCDTAPETKGMAKHDLPAQPLDLLFPLDTSLPQVSEPIPADEAHEPLPTYPPLFRRIRARPRRIAAPASVSAPDWKLSTGAAVILLGFAVVFGTYVTLTQRDAMQSRLRRIVGQNELRTAPRHDHASIADRTQELARTLREQIETLRSRDATDAAVMAGAATRTSANAHSSTLASSAPGLPPTPSASSSPPPPRKTPAKQLSAKQLAPPLPQSAPRARQLASAAPARPHNATTAAQQEHRTVAKQPSAQCGTRAPCAQANTQNAHKPVKVANKTTPKAGTKTVAARSAVAKAPAKPAPRNTPVTVQAWSPPDNVTVLPASDDTQIFRQH